MLEIEATLQTALDDRLDADATLATLVGDRFWYEEAAQDAQFPYLVYDVPVVTLDDATDGFTHDAVNAQVAVTIYHKPAEHAEVRSIQARVFGNSIPSSQTDPTFGLHLWTPDLSAGQFDAGPMLFRQFTKAISTPDARAYLMEFDLQVWRSSNS